MKKMRPLHGTLSLLAAAVAASVASASGCSSNGPAPAAAPSAKRADLLDPDQCKSCHPNHWADWSTSMHAKAADDPVFIAMNKRGQRETNGKLGTFCVNCHAPMAVRDGLTQDGLNLDSLDAKYKGVTCYFCHSIDSVGTQHNNASVHLSDDLVMRAELADAQPNGFHASTYSTLHDTHQPDSATMCGTCHDIVAPAGGHVERTFAEWQSSIFSHPGGLTCVAENCHMNVDRGITQAAVGGPQRAFHKHDFPAVDVPMTPTPENQPQV